MFTQQPKPSHLSFKLAKQKREKESKTLAYNLSDIRLTFSKSNPIILPLFIFLAKLF